MKRRFILYALSLLLPLIGLAQNNEIQSYKLAFNAAYEACPDIPRGLLEAVSFTNTHCYHLTDANYFHDDPEAMPRAYGLMGLVKDGKGYFRENLHLVSELSGISEVEILGNPEKNALAYAMAFSRLAKENEAKEIKDYLLVIQQLSELPIGKKKDVYPMHSMLYSVCVFLNNAKNALQYDFKQYHIDLTETFPEDIGMLTASEIGISRDSDYPQAIWDPAAECNYSNRTNPVSAVVIHDAEGSYAGCISWFKNCEAQVSAHYVIRSSDGQVTQMVREADKAWHARSANAYTIGIEHEGYASNPVYFTDAMYRSSADLVRNICSRYATIDGHRTFYRDVLDDGTHLNSGLHDLGGEDACTKIRGHQHYPDQSHTDPGPYWDWNYYYKLINEGTLVTVLGGEEGHLDHQNYGDDERKIWVIRGPEGKSIQLVFSSFSLEDNYDFMWIYDGDNVYAPEIGRWNTQSPGTVQSTSNVMCVEFRSDCATTSTGWEASWKAKKPSVPIPNPGSEVPETASGVFPNPTNDKFTVKSDLEGFTDLVVYDLYGNIMTSIRFQKSVEIDASGWASGVYVVHYGEPFYMGKVVKLTKL